MSTMLVSAALLILSALSEVSSLGDPVPLFGAVRGGAVAALYHLIYVGLFAALGFALVKRKSWGYRLVLGATAFYTMDKLIYVLDGKARAAEIDHALHRYDGMLDRWGIDLSSISRVMAAAALLQVLSWWGFAAYCRWRRAFFSEP